MRCWWLMGRIWRMAIMLLLPIWVCSSLSGCAGTTYQLMQAAYNGQTKNIRMLLDKGADVNAKQSSDGATALQLASWNGHTEIAKLLVDKGADVNTKRSTDGVSALQLASWNGHTEIAKLLVDKGADINTKRTTDGTSALQWASEKGHTEIAKLLVDKGADVNTKRSTDGVSALLLASWNGHTEIAKLLVDKGADVNAKRSTDGTTPLYWASWKGHTDIVRLLVDKGADVNSKTLVDKGADVNSTTKDGQTALKVACQTGNDGLVIYLYEKGARIGLEDSSIEGMEANAALHHILGDHFLAQDSLDKARISYVKTREYYGKLADKYNGDVTKLAWKQFGVIMGRALSGAILSYASSYQASMQSRQRAQISAMKHAQKTHTGFQGYSSYMTKYKQAYVPTYQRANITSLRPPSGSASLGKRKAYAKAQAKHYKDRSALIDKILNCFDKNPNEADLHVCVRRLTVQEEK